MAKQKIAITTDCVVFYKASSEKLKILLVERKNEPFKNDWALPGGFLEDEEPLEEGAKRELKEETGLQIFEVYQLRAFGNPGRDPRGRTISIAFWGEVFSEEKVEGSDDAKDAKWFDLENLPELAFDHKQIIEFAKKVYKSEKS
ncbi:NUDIX domain-containing protein [Salinimicrobium gaetbulicola]|uniref:NUDIX domain-containing protein n=1 Tax=Salinimicrobium gaetbulicola TaxID=999702 RepID=A0ABW3IBP0_9FLAO